MPKKKKRTRRNPALMEAPVPDEILIEQQFNIRELAEAVVVEALPELSSIFNEILDNVSMDMGFNVRKEFPGIEKTLMHVIRTTV
jgi:hypothetical protein